MIPLIGAEFRVIAGRRGAYRTAMFGPVVAVAATAMLFSALHMVDPGRWPSIGGTTGFVVATTLINFIIVMSAVVIGAVAGSYDQAAGIARYRVLTGVSRWRLYLARVPALLLVYLGAVAVGTAAVGVLAGLPHEAGTGVTVTRLLHEAWTLFLPAAVYGLLSMAVGTLLGTVRSAVTVSFLLCFAAAPLLLAVSSWSERLGDLFLPAAVVELTTPADTTAPALLLAVAVLLVWLGAPLLAGALRIHHSEL